MAKLQRKKRKNQEPSAAAMSEAFHGRPARKVKEHLEVVTERTELADLGRMVDLVVIVNGKHRAIPFSGKTRLACSPDGGQLYFVGGDQSLDLESLGIRDQQPKDNIQIGAVKSIAYFTSKVFHDFEPQTYEHQFGEPRGSSPLLAYSSLNQALFLVGGTYQVKPEGIVN